MVGPHQQSKLGPTENVQAVGRLDKLSITCVLHEYMELLMPCATLNSVHPQAQRTLPRLGHGLYSASVGANRGGGHCVSEGSVARGGADATQCLLLVGTHIAHLVPHNN